MQAGTSTGTTCQVYTRPNHRDANTVGRPFAFLPKRRRGAISSRITGNEPGAPLEKPFALLNQTESTTLSLKRFPTDPFPVQDSVSPSVDFPALTTMNEKPIPIPAFLRKKSGELVKPSLKTSHPSCNTRPRSKSAPATPTVEPPKSVHFDAQLEYVKLFMAEQKPLAVSRGGTPTETSEGDTTDTAPCFSPLPLQLRLLPISFPAALRVSTDPWTFDVRLEAISLPPISPPALTGTILVNNLAYSKSVVVRFTLDDWQTTSEISAKYLASIRGGSYDRFEFRIGLGDWVGGTKALEERRVVLCVRYSVDGWDVWDNNGGVNYHVGFKRVEGVRDVRTTTKVTAVNDKRDSLRASRKPRILPVDDSDSDTDSDDLPIPLDKPSPEPTLASPLAARYDFKASLREKAWTPGATAASMITPRSPPPPHSMASSTPNDPLTPSRNAAISQSRVIDNPPRNHSRGWAQSHETSYFDRVVRRTPARTGTPVSAYGLEFPHAVMGLSSSDESQSTVLDDERQLAGDQGILSSPLGEDVPPLQKRMGELPVKGRADTEWSGVVLGSTGYSSLLDQLCFFRGANAYGPAHQRTDDYFTLTPPRGERLRAQR